MTTKSRPNAADGGSGETVRPEGGDSGPGATGRPGSGESGPGVTGRPGSGEAGPGESDQIIQRRANLAALQQLGVDVYPRKFEAQATIEAVVGEHGSKTSEELEAGQLRTRIAGRILAIRVQGPVKVCGYQPNR